MSSDDKLALGLILALIIAGAVVAVSAAVSDMVVKTSCFEHGGSWTSNACTLDKNHEQ